MNPSPVIRLIRHEELPALLELYHHLHLEDPRLPITPHIEQLWEQILATQHLRYLVAEVNGRIVSTCTLAILPNLTRSARPYALIENVVTHPEFRRQGIATRLLQFALALAWDANCYKVMLLTGRKDEATLRFYQNAGFQPGLKTAFLASPDR